MHRSHLNVNKVAEGAEGSRVEVRELRYSVRWFGDRSSNCGWCRVTRDRGQSMTVSRGHVDLLSHVILVGNWETVFRRNE